MNYAGVVAAVLSGEIQTNARTGKQIFAVPHLSMTVDLSAETMPLPGLRRVFPRSAAAEVAWCLKGSQRIEWLQKYTGIWNAFAKDGVISTAYGWRWRHAYGVDQIMLAVTALKDDPSSRQVVVQAWSPVQDPPWNSFHGLTKEKRDAVTNVPCPIGFVLSPINDVLHLAVTLRSSDVAVGLPYDAMGYGLLLDLLAREVGMRPGLVTLWLSHAHLYSQHLKVMQDALMLGQGGGDMALPAWSLSAVEANPEKWVELVTDLASTTERRPTFIAKLDAVL